MFTLAFANSSITLAASPEQAQFSYDLNTQEYGTVAGRVVQILSARVSTLTVTAKVAGPDAYADYLRLVTFCRDLMAWQAEGDQPARFVFPALGWDITVFLKQVQLSDSLRQAAYPYTLTFEVDEDLSGVVTAGAMESTFRTVREGVGWVPGAEGWHGGTGATYEQTVGASAGSAVSAAAEG